MRLVNVAALVAGLLWSGTAHAGGLADALEATWRVTSTSREQIDANIEHTVSRLTGWAIIKRPFVRSKLKESTPVCRQMKIWETPDGQIATQCDGLKTVVAPPDGRRMPWRTPDGDEFTLTHEVENGRLVQTFFSSKGSKTTVFERQGDALRLHVTIHSKHLPEDVSYSMTFEA
jgi:hypothetical protein